MFNYYLPLCKEEEIMINNTMIMKPTAPLIPATLFFWKKNPSKKKRPSKKKQYHFTGEYVHLHAQTLAITVKLRPQEPKKRAPSQARTGDLQIMRLTLYQLSHRGFCCELSGELAHELGTKPTFKELSQSNQQLYRV